VLLFSPAVALARSVEDDGEVFEAGVLMKRILRRVRRDVKWVNGGAVESDWVD
jgi:hypothetical protein